MSATAPVTFAVDAEGVGWIAFDDPAARANVFNAATLTALDQAIDAAMAARPCAVVVVSGKDRIFIAGADLHALAALPDAASAAEFSARGQRLLQRLAEFPAPVVCAIHGACAGGGCELALACHWRIASDAAVTRIGLPETVLGTIPGWGGCVRLPRLIGVRPALDHILRGQLISADEAQAAGIVNEVVPAAELARQAKARALRLAAEGLRAVAVPAAVPPGTFEELRGAVQARTRGRNPALLAAIEAVEQTVARPLSMALTIEARLFGAVTAGETCKNLIRVFLLREAARKRTLAGWFEGRAGLRPAWEEGAGQRPALPSRVGVIGAGVMGSGIAHWLAAHGLDVVLRDVAPEAIEHGQAVIRRLLDEAVKRGKTTAAEADAARARIATTTEWAGLADCDLVIEAIVEDVEAKRRLFAELAQVVRPDTVLASNTSALPIEEIAARVPHPERALGIHFFNPVSRMPLVELIISRQTSPPAAERAIELVRRLGKSPVICRSSPGFLVTRVLFFYLNAAVRRWGEGASTAAIDGAMADFGWPMGPLRLIDEIGVDVTDFIFGEMARYFPQRFERTATCGRLAAAGLKGRKNGASRGFYRYDASTEQLNESEAREVAGGTTVRGPGSASADPCVALMQVMVDEARRCLAEGVVQSPDDVDFALLAGAGFPAFRGGLLRWADASGRG